jgi:DNA processing protein
VPGSAGLADWVRLERTAGVGLEMARRLLAAFGLPENIFHAGYPALNKIAGADIAAALSGPIPEQIAALVAATVEWAAQPGNHVLTLAGSLYPATLLDMPDPPLILYAKGRIELLSRPALAVVGSRNATAQGLLNAEKFSEALSAAGLTIISGMALGIDTSAHQGALRNAESDAGSTVAVIGTGADIVYPARNRALAHRIAEHGCIVSEYPLGMPALPANFPRRNRIISGLSRGVLVVEAAAQSGSLITARMAVEQGRDVFAVPGSIHSPLSKGCHQLIRQGAKLVESAQDVLEEMRFDFMRPAHVHAGDHGGTAPGRASKSPEGAMLLRAMGFDPVDGDALSQRTGMDAAALSGHLLALELDGLIEMLPGGRYRRIE